MSAPTADVPLPPAADPVEPPADAPPAPPARAKNPRLCRDCGTKYAQELGLCRTCSRARSDPPAPPVRTIVHEGIRTDVEDRDATIVAALVAAGAAGLLVAELKARMHPEPWASDGQQHVALSNSLRRLRLKGRVRTDGAGRWFIS